MREIITNVNIWVLFFGLFLHLLLMSMKTEHTQSSTHTWRGLWLLGQQVRLLDQHVTEASDKPRD